MTNLTQQIVLKVSPELDTLLDKAFEKSVQETGNPPTRSDFIRSALEAYCNHELKEYKSSPNPYVKDPILNKVIWTLLCRIYQASLENQKPFRELHLNDFIVGARIEVEEVFNLLQDKGIVTLGKDHKNFTTLRLRSSNIPEINAHLMIDQIEQLKNIARENIIMSSAMNNFIKLLKLWNTPENRNSVTDICFFSWHLPQAKNNLSENGFIITSNSKTHIPNNWFVRDMINDAPSEYANQLWGMHRKNDEINTELYITYPDIFIG